MIASQQSGHDNENLKQTQLAHKNKQKALLHLILGTGGIYASYVILAIYSQQLYNSTYESKIQINPDDGSPAKHNFLYPNAIVWMSAFCCTIFGFLRNLISKEPPSPIPVPIKQSIIMGILFAMNMLATNVAFLYISYPTQVIASSSRYLFVILVGSFLSRVPHKDYLKLPKIKIYVALLITLGVILFNVRKLHGRDLADHHAYPEEWKGYILVIVSMTADAFLCDNQAYAKALFKPSVNQLSSLPISGHFSLSPDMQLLQVVSFLDLNFFLSILNVSSNLRQFVLYRSLDKFQFFISLATSSNTFSL